MKLVAILMTMLTMSCLPYSGSRVKTTEDTNPLANLYQGEIIDNLHNWTDEEKVTADKVKATKQAIMDALGKVGFNTLPKPEADKLLVGFDKEHAVISVLATNKLCSGNDRSACFHLQIVPSGHDVYAVTVVKLPAYDDLGAIAENWSDENIEELLTTLGAVLPHSIEKDQLQVESRGKDKNLTLVLLTDETPKRELHIEARDGMIDNSRNAKHQYRVYQDEMTL